MFIQFDNKLINLSDIAYFEISDTGDIEEKTYFIFANLKEDSNHDIDDISNSYYRWQFETEEEQLKEWINLSMQLKLLNTINGNKDFTNLYFSTTTESKL